MGSFVGCDFSFDLAVAQVGLVCNGAWPGRIVRRYRFDQDAAQVMKVMLPDKSVLLEL